MPIDIKSYIKHHTWIYKHISFILEKSEAWRGQFSSLYHGQNPSEVYRYLCSFHQVTFQVKI